MPKNKRPSATGVPLCDSHEEEEVVVVEQEDEQKQQKQQRSSDGPASPATDIDLDRDAMLQLAQQPDDAALATFLARLPFARLRHLATTLGAPPSISVTRQAASAWLVDWARTQPRLPTESSAPLQVPENSSSVQSQLRKRTVVK